MLCQLQQQQCCAVAMETEANSRTSMHVSRMISVMVFWHHLASLPSARKHRQHDPPGRMIISTTKTETKINRGIALIILNSEGLVSDIAVYLCWKGTLNSNQPTNHSDRPIAYIHLYIHGSRSLIPTHGYIFGYIHRYPYSRQPCRYCISIEIILDCIRRLKFR